MMSPPSEDPTIIGMYECLTMSAEHSVKSVTKDKINIKIHVFKFL
jgi:hypothetical protein